MDERRSQQSRQTALANSQGAAPNEVEAALRQARNLMTQYNLEYVEVTAHAVDEACVVTRPPPSRLVALTGIDVRGRIRLLPPGISSTGWSIKFMGKGISPELAAYAYMTLHP